MPEHIIIYETNVYECLNCGLISEPPWMTPPPDIAQDAKDHFISEHKDCQSVPLGAKAYSIAKIDHAN
jgi:hypothetical protein